MTDFTNILNGITDQKNQEVEQKNGSHQYQEKKLALHSMLQAVSHGQLDVTWLDENHFEDPLWWSIYSCSLKVSQKNERLTINHLREIDLLKKDAEINIDDFIKHLFDEASLIESSMVTGFTNDLIDFYNYKKLKNQLNDALSKLSEYNYFSQVKEICEGLTENINNSLASHIVSKETYSFSEMLDNFIQKVQSNEKALSTGLINLDNLSGGFFNGDLIILAGRPSMGKTALQMHFIYHVCLQGKNVFNFSLEMNQEQSASRYISLNSFIDKEVEAVSYKNITHKKVDNETIVNLTKRLKQSNLPLTTDFGTNNIDQIIFKAKKHAYDLSRQGKRLDMITIDYLQIIPHKVKTTKNDAISEISQKLKSLAKSLDVPVIVLSQLNREADKERRIEDRIPRMSHLRDSGSIEQDADVIFLVNRPAYHEKDIDEDKRKYRDDYMEIIIDKSRQGETGRVKCGVYLSKNYMFDIDQKDDGRREEFNNRVDY